MINGGKGPLHRVVGDADRGVEIEVQGDRETIRKQLDEACHKFLSNPVIEDYKLEIE